MELVVENVLSEDLVRVCFHGDVVSAFACVESLAYEDFLPDFDNVKPVNVRLLGLFTFCGDASTVFGPTALCKALLEPATADAASLCAAAVVSAQSCRMKSIFIVCARLRILWR